MVTSSIVDGRGGRYWLSNITFPVYEDAYPIKNWKIIDYWNNRWQQTAATAGVCLGLCIMGLLAMVAFTPAAKRGRPLFTLSLATFVALILRNMALILTITSSGIGSAYFQIIGSIGCNFSFWTSVNYCCSIWAAPIPMILIEFCFFLQARAVLSLFKIRYPKLYYLMMGSLVTLGFVAVCIRLVEASYQTIIWFRVDLVYIQPPWVSPTTLALYAASIISWSLVFTVQIVFIIWNRFKLGMRVNRSEAMSILMMTGVESMLLPITFAVLSLCKFSWFQRAEYLIIPSVAIILPFGSILAGAAELNQTSPTSDPRICAHCHELIDNNASEPSSDAIGTNSNNISKPLSPLDPNLRSPINGTHSVNFNDPDRINKHPSTLSCSTFTGGPATLSRDSVRGGSSIGSPTSPSPRLRQ